MNKDLFVDRTDGARTQDYEEEEEDMLKDPLTLAKQSFSVCPSSVTCALQKKVLHAKFLHVKVLPSRCHRRHGSFLRACVCTRRDLYGRNRIFYAVDLQGGSSVVASPCYAHWM